MNKVVTKVAMLVFAVALAIGVSSCNNGTTVQSTQADNQKVSQPAQQSVQQPAYNPITKWDFTDYIGQKHSIEINADDETAKLHSNGRTDYGSFSKNSYRPGRLYFRFPLEMDGIRVYFEKPYSPFNPASPLSSAVIDINNDYLYVNESAYDAKDPTRRLKVTKR